MNQNRLESGVMMSPIPEINAYVSLLERGDYAEDGFCTLSNSYFLPNPFNVSLSFSTSEFF